MVRFNFGEESDVLLGNGVSEERICRAYGADRHRAVVVDRAIERLCRGDLAGKGHVERYLRHKYRVNCSAGTICSNTSFLESFLIFLRDCGKTDLEQITRRDLEGFIEHEQDRGLKPQTVGLKVKLLKAFVRFLIGEGVVDSELLNRRITVKVPDALARAIEAEDLRRLLGVIEDVRDRAMVMVLLRTGMRIGELLATRVEDVLLEERKILIYEAQKNRVGRVVYLSDDALEALGVWFRKRDPQRAFVFYAQGRNTMSYGTARGMFYRHLVKAGLSHKGYSLHCLRHTFATELLNAGMRLECLRVLLGHRSLEVTRRYARLTDRTREEQYFTAMAKIEKEHSDVRHQLDCELQALLEEKELLDPHGEELPEQP
jgi:integrase/recombinase XerD